MRLRVLGCSGGIGGQQNRTTSFLVDQDILIDAGTGVGDLSLAELKLIDHIFVTHSHLDHVNSIAFFLDSVGALRPKPVTVYATGPTIETLKKHLFNWDIWPDFTVDPHARAAVVALPGDRGRGSHHPRRTEDHGAARDSHGARGRLSARQRQGQPGLHRRHRAERRAVERGEPDRESQVPHHRNRVFRQGPPACRASQHLCPSMLGEELAKLERPAEIYITHLKPSEIELTMQEIEELSGNSQPRLLQNNHVFEF